MKSRPHIILEALQVRENPAGTARGIMDLCQALAERDRDLDFTLLTSGGGMFPGLADRPGWRVREFPGVAGSALRRAWFIQFRLPGLVRRLGGDLLHSMQFLAPLRCPCLQVATVHDLAWVRFPETIEEPRRSYYRWLVPRTLKNVDAVVANSRSTAGEIAGYFPAVAAKVHVTFHGTPRWVLDRAREPQRTDRAGRRPFFLFVGTLEPRKNLSRTLAAYEAFLASEQVLAAEVQAVPDLVLAGGRGWRDGPLRRRMTALRETGRLRVLDYCDPDELWNLYRDALALVFPSLHEGFGLPILEAMAAGLPVLTSDRGGTAEVAGDGALLVDPENCAEITAGLIRLAFDEPLRLALASGGPDRARQWSWSRTADLTCEVYQHLLGPGEGRKQLPPLP